MRSKALSFRRQVLRGSLTQGTQSLGRCWGAREEFPRALALEQALGETLLARGPQQAATGSTAVAFESVVGPRHAWHVIAVEQAGPIASADLVEVQTKRREGGCDLRQPQPRVKIATELSRDGGSARGLRRRGFSDGGNGAEPGSAVAEFLGGLSTGGQGRLEALIQLGAAHSAVPAGRDGTGPRSGAARRSPDQPADRAAGL